MKRLLFAGVLTCLCMSVLVEAATVFKWLEGAQTTLLSAQLNNFSPTGTTTASTTYNNVVGGGQGDGATRCIFEGFFTFTANPTPNSAVFVWLLRAPDGANFESTPTASVTLGRLPNVRFPVTQGTTVTRVTQEVECPSGLWQAVANSQGTGQSMAASGNFIKVKPLTLQGVSQ